MYSFGGCSPFIDWHVFRTDKINALNTPTMYLCVLVGSTLIPLFTKQQMDHPRQLSYAMKIKKWMVTTLLARHRPYVLSLLTLHQP